MMRQHCWSIWSHHHRQTFSKSQNFHFFLALSSIGGSLEPVPWDSCTTSYLIQHGSGREHVPSEQFALGNCSCAMRVFLALVVGPCPYFLAPVVHLCSERHCWAVEAAVQGVSLARIRVSLVPHCLFHQELVEMELMSLCDSGWNELTDGTLC